MRVTFGDPLLVVTFVRGLLLMEQEMADGIPGKSQYLKKKANKGRGEGETNNLNLFYFYVFIFSFTY